MSNELTISLGQYSDKGRKEINQDFHGALMPEGHVLAMKGITVALTDGISSSSVSHVAAESTIKSLLTDYYCTSDAWSVKTSVLQVIKASNSWLYAETKRSQHAYDMDKGYVCTLCAIVLKSHYAHLFHVGDSRIYRVSGDSLEQLTSDHRLVVSSEENYLSRAIGMAQSVDVDYRQINLSEGDIFVLATDGIFESNAPQTITRSIHENSHDLDKAAQKIVADAFANGSGDNLTVQIVRIDTLPLGDPQDFIFGNGDLPAPPILEPRASFEGYTILRELPSNNRSHIYLARDEETAEEVALKIPSIDLRDNPAYLHRFMMEEWIARRLNSAHVLKAGRQTRTKNFVYVVTEFVEGQTLSQWMVDNPKPDIETVRDIIEQISKGLRAFHRKEMLHQDLRPENVMIDNNGTVKIIDFGSTKVAGVSEVSATVNDDEVLGTLQYAAPEYFLGQTGTRKSDFFSLGVIAYQMLTGKLPYGTQVSRSRTKAQQKRLRYASAVSGSARVPNWVDGALKKAVNPDPFKRYDTLSEFTLDLRKPNKHFSKHSDTPMAERNPVGFWKSVSLLQAVIIVVVLLKLAAVY